jgi:HlyD family secretion protein
MIINRIRKETKMKKKGRKKFIIIFAVIIVIGIIIFFNLQARREKSIKVTLEEVKSQDITSIVSASGEVKPRKNINISAHVPGRVVKIGVEEGQRVKTDDFLLKLDSTQYEANTSRDRASIRSLKAELIKAEASLKKDENYFYRQKKLFEEKLISNEQLEAAKAQYDISYAQHEAIRYQIKQAEASLQSSLDNLSKTVYNSPIDGIITSLQVEEGEVAMIGTMNNPGTILMTIADLSVMEVEVEVDETDVINVNIDQSAKVRIDAFPDMTIDGKVTEVGSSALQKVTVSEESKDFKVVITLENPPEDLKPGLSASADIITGEKEDVLAVPISALVLREKEEKEKKDKDEQEEGIYVVDKENRVKFRAVKKGIMGGMTVEAVSGLEKGEKIVVGPYDALRQLNDGTLINPEEKQKKDNE